MSGEGQYRKLVWTLAQILSVYRVASIQGPGGSPQIWRERLANDLQWLATLTILLDREDLGKSEIWSEQLRSALDEQALTILDKSEGWPELLRSALDEQKRSLLLPYPDDNRLAPAGEGRKWIERKFEFKILGSTLKEPGEAEEGILALSAHEAKFFLESLRSAPNEVEREWLILELNLDRLPGILKEAVWAAAVPRWFDLHFLAAELGVSWWAVGVSEIFAKLIGLSYVEPSPIEGCYNIHERSRDLLLRKLWSDRKAVYMMYSRRAAEFCAAQDQSTVIWRIESIYHLLIADPASAKRMLAKTVRDWSHAPFDNNNIEALERAIREHCDAGRLDASVFSRWFHT